MSEEELLRTLITVRARAINYTVGEIASYRWAVLLRGARQLAWRKVCPRGLRIRWHELHLRASQAYLLSLRATLRSQKDSQLRCVARLGELAAFPQPPGPGSPRRAG